MLLEHLGSLCASFLTLWGRSEPRQLLDHWFFYTHAGSSGHTIVWFRWPVSLVKGPHRPMLMQGSYIKRRGERRQLNPSGTCGLFWAARRASVTLTPVCHVYPPRGLYLTLFVQLISEAWLVDLLYGCALWSHFKPLSPDWLHFVFLERSVEGRSVDGADLLCTWFRLIPARHVSPVTVVVFGRNWCHFLRKKHSLICQLKIRTCSVQ